MLHLGALSSVVGQYPAQRQQQEMSKQFLFHATLRLSVEVIDGEQVFRNLVQFFSF